MQERETQKSFVAKFTLRGGMLLNEGTLSDLALSDLHGGNQESKITPLHAPSSLMGALAAMSQFSSFRPGSRVIKQGAEGWGGIQ